MFKVLVYTDDILLYKAINIITSKAQKFQVIDIGTNTMDVMNICKNETVDFVFIDVNIPYIDTIKICNSIYHFNPDISIYLIASSRKSAIVLQEKINFVKGIIEKPVTYLDLEKILDDYKTENENSLFINCDEILSLINNNDFKNFYFNLGNIINQIYEIGGTDSLKLTSLFTYVAYKLMYQRNYYDDRQDLLTMFPLNETMILDKVVSEAWLFKVVDYLFQKKCEDRYPLLSDVFIYINNNIKMKIALNDITEKCSISQGYLSRIFREQLGVSVMDYIHIKKMHIAKNYFYFTAYSIADVTFKLGYNESSYFSKVFKKYEGKTVKEYKIENCGSKDFIE